MSLFKATSGTLSAPPDNPTVSILVAKVGVCLAQEPAAFKAFLPDGLIFGPVCLSEVLDTKVTFS